MYSYGLVNNLNTEFLGHTITYFRQSLYFWMVSFSPK